MESPSLLLLDPKYQGTKNIRCVGDLYKLKEERMEKLSAMLSDMSYFVIDGNHRWVQKYEHLQLYPEDKKNSFYKFTPAQIYVGLTQEQSR